MATTAFVPDSTASCTATVVGAATPHEAINDNSDSTYIQNTSYSLNRDWSGVIPFGNKKVVDDVATVVIRCKYGSSSASSFIVSLRQLGEGLFISKTLTAGGAAGDLTWILSSAEQQALLEKVNSGVAVYCYVTIPKSQAILYEVDWNFTVVDAAAGLEMGCNF